MPDCSELPPTGAVVSVPYVGVHTVRAGRLVRSHYYWDQMEFLKALGLLPG
jgi:ketosteroid isomerase-like protein